MVADVDHGELTTSSQIDRRSSRIGSVTATTTTRAKTAARMSRARSLRRTCVRYRRDTPLASTRVEPDPHAHEEGRRHALAALVEELDHRVVGADGDDQLGSVLVGQQHGDVLAGPGRLEALVGHAVLFEPVGARRPAARVGVDDHRRPAAQRPLRHRVEVADDDVGRVAQLQQGVGSPVDADEHRLHLLEVAALAEDAEVLAVVEPAHDDEGVPALDVDADRRAPGGRR